MPAPIDIAAYQLGVRLTQCLILQRDCIHAGPGGQYPPPSDFSVLVQHSIVCLDQAFDWLVSTGSLWGSLAEVAKALIDDCEPVWQRCAVMPAGELNFGEIGGSPLQNSLLTLAGLVGRILAQSSPGGQTAEVWFRLGCLICEGYMEQPSRYLLALDPPPPGYENGERPPRGEPEWVWRAEEEMDRAIEETGTTYEELCPEIAWEEVMNLLPYDPEPYGQWFWVEAGLSELLSKFGTEPADDATAAETAQKSGSGDRAGVPREPETSGKETAELRLRVDIEKRIAYWDGEPINLERDDVAKFVAALVEAKGAWVSPKDIIRRFPGLEGLRPSRLKKKIPDPIGGLVETQDAKGSRISVDRLLPPDLLKTLWSDQT